MFFCFFLMAVAVVVDYLPMRMVMLVHNVSIDRIT